MDSYVIGYKNIGDGMKNSYTAVLKQYEDSRIGWIEEIPGVNYQEKDYSTLVKTLQLTLKEALDFNRKDALEAAGSEYRELSIPL